MDDNLSAELQVRLADEAYVYDLGSFSERVDGLVDQRKARGKRYALAFILTRMVLAKRSGEATPSAIADWVQQRSALLSAAFRLKRRTLPCRNTYRRVSAQAVAPPGVADGHERMAVFGRRSRLACADQPRGQDAARHDR